MVMTYVNRGNIPLSAHVKEKKGFIFHRIVRSWVSRVIVGVNCTDRPEPGTVVPAL